MPGRCYDIVQMQYKCFPSSVSHQVLSVRCFPSSVFRQVFSVKCCPSSVFREMFSVRCFPSSVFRQLCSSEMFTTSVKCCPSSVFHQVFSVKRFLSNVRHFLDGGVFRSIGNFSFGFLHGKDFGNTSKNNPEISVMEENIITYASENPTV